LSFLLGTFASVVPTEKTKDFYNELIDAYLCLFQEALRPNGVIEVRFG